MATLLIRCVCSHEYQDKEYGRYMRVHNEGVKQSSDSIKYRCTVCGDVKYR